MILQEKEIEGQEGSYFLKWFGKRKSLDAELLNLQGSADTASVIGFEYPGAYSPSIRLKINADVVKILPEG